MSKEDVEMRWGRGQQRGSSGNCYGDDVSGNWKVVSFVAFVCEMGAIPARRNRHTYIYRLIVVYVQLRRIHNHPSQLGEYTISRRGGVPAHGIRLANFELGDVEGFLPRLWQLRYVWRVGEISTWVNCGPFRIGPHLHRINFIQSVLVNRHHYR